MLEPIEDANLGSVHALLARGFPARPSSFWREGLERLAAHHDRIQAGPIGHLLRVKGQHAGVILTMRSLRANGPRAPRRMVNLSSWYIDEPHRWLGPRMLRQILQEPDTEFTDLTPSDSVEELNRRLGLVPLSEGALVAALPLATLARGRSKAAVVPFERLPPAALSGPERAMAEDHAALGCLCAGLDSGAGWQLLIFAPIRRKGVPAARVVYAPSRAALQAAIAPVARFLMARGVLALAIAARREERLTGAWFTHRARPTFGTKGVDPEAIDHAYSEFVLLRY
jgi:hypothetical protein